MHATNGRKENQNKLTRYFSTSTFVSGSKSEEISKKRKTSSTPLSIDLTNSSKILTFSTSNSKECELVDLTSENSKVTQNINEEVCGFREKLFDSDDYQPKTKTRRLQQFSTSSEDSDSENEILRGKNT
jgi:hypothetical protein